MPTISTTRSSTLHGTGNDGGRQEHCPQEQYPLEQCHPEQCPQEQCPQEQCAQEQCPLKQCPPEQCPPEQCPPEQCPQEQCPLEEWTYFFVINLTEKRVVMVITESPAKKAFTYVTACLLLQPNSSILKGDNRLKDGGGIERSKTRCGNFLNSRLKDRKGG